MVSSIFVQASAKINLALRVGQKSNGFHEIGSIFQEISLADDVFVALGGNGCTLRCLGASLPTENTLTKAYRFFCQATGFRSGVEVTILKRIPSGAGLGGGSSDAVAFLKALNTLGQTKCSQSQLLTLAAQVGSDCPFFVEGGAAYVSGRGEKVSPIGSRFLQGILLFPQVESSSEKAYGLLDDGRVENTFAPSIIDGTNRELLVRSFASEPLSAWASECGGNFSNDFEPVVMGEFPRVAEAKRALQQTKADFVLMSGSGSSVFGLFESSQALNEAYQALRKRFSFCVPFISR